MKGHTVRIGVGTLLLFTAGVAAAQVPFSGLSEKELSALSAGDPVTRIAEDADSLAIPPTLPGAADLVESIRKLKPNYLVEVISSFPFDGRDIPGILQTTLSRPETWVGIPYWSERNEKTYDLFDKCDVVSRKDEDGGEAFEVLHHMKPFDDYTSRYEYRIQSASFVFSGVNSSPLIYKGVKAVTPGNMAWRIIAWTDGSTWYFYGVGAVKAFDMFGAVRNRLEPSFIGRTKAFFDFMRLRLQ